MTPDHEGVTERQMAAFPRGGAYLVAGVSPNVGGHSDQSAPAPAGEPDPSLGMTNHPPTGYPSSLKLLNKFKTAYPLKKFVTHQFPVDKGGQGDGDNLRCRQLMKVVLTPNGG